MTEAPMADTNRSSSKAKVLRKKKTLALPLPHTSLRSLLSVIESYDSSKISLSCTSSSDGGGSNMRVQQVSSLLLQTNEKRLKADDAAPDAGYHGSSKAALHALFDLWSQELSASYCPHVRLVPFEENLALLQVPAPQEPVFRKGGSRLKPT